MISIEFTQKELELLLVCILTKMQTNNKACDMVTCQKARKLIDSETSQIYKLNNKLYECMKK